MRMHRRAAAAAAAAEGREALAVLCHHACRHRQTHAARRRASISSSSSGSPLLALPKPLPVPASPLAKNRLTACGGQPGCQSGQRWRPGDALFHASSGDPSCATIAIHPIECDSAAPADVRDLIEPHLFEVEVCRAQHLQCLCFISSRDSHKVGHDLAVIHRGELSHRHLANSKGALYAGRALNCLVAMFEMRRGRRDSIQLITALDS